MSSSNSGVEFDSSLRRVILNVLSALTSKGYSFFSSHIADQFGKQFDEASMVERDNNWVNECDIYLGLVPLDGSGMPRRTDGTWVEVGLALAFGKRVVLAIEDQDNPHQSYYVRNLKRLKQVRFVEWEYFRSNMISILEEEAANLVNQHTGQRWKQQTPIGS